MNILFFHRGTTDFILRDRKLLSQLGSLEAFDHNQMSAGDYLRAFFLARKNSVDLLFCWFAGRHAVFPTILSILARKPLILVAGGWDVVNLPEIRYGLMRSGWKKIIAKWILAHSSRVLAVSGSNYREILENSGMNPQKVKLVFHGIEIPREKVSREGKEELVLSVGEVTPDNLRRKGIETFIECARRLPDKQFFLVGRVHKKLKRHLEEIIPPNLSVTGYVSREVLEKFFRRASVYVQASYHEAFGCSLAESMAYGCVPVATSRFALPEVVGPCGIYVPYGDVQATVEGIRKAFNARLELGALARERVASLFPVEKRLNAFKELLERYAIHPICRNL